MDDPCDFPAAHSMDTMWFAVDRDGHVAVFESGEAGAVPDEAYLGEEYFEAVQAVATSDDDDEEIADLSRHGLYVYRHGDETENWIAGPYTRNVAPDAPALAATLPASVIEKAVRFDGSFATTEAIQPVEVWPSSAWGAAYLASDRKTVRPIPGSEDRYAEEIADLAEPLGDGDLIVTPLAGGAPEARLVPPRPWWKRLFGKD
jgi:hypothetical protein